MRWANLPVTTLIDYPGRVAATLFTIGCNFRCPFCHNPELVLPERSRESAVVTSDAVLASLVERCGFFDGVVITGGEPTTQSDLVPFARRVKELGYRVKLDTNGSRPDVLESLFDFNLVDYVAVDLKGPRPRYERFAGVVVDASRIERSIGLVRQRAPDYEFRTTVAPGLTAESLDVISRWIDGAKRYVLQPFCVPREKQLVDPTWASRRALSENQLREVWKRLRHRFDDGGVRG
jgi:pyruvate formate lyase activating enzyme